MGWDGSGNLTLTDGVYTSNWAQNWSADADPEILDTEHDALLLDVQNSIQACLPHNGEKAATSNIPMGGYRLTGLGAPSANTDAGKYGNQIASGAYSSPNIVMTRVDGTTFNIDVSSLESGTGGVDLTTDQAIAGAKAFEECKFNGATVSKVLTPTPGSAVTVDSTGADRHYVTIGVNTTINFTWPTAASDSQLGANWMVTGSILCRHTGAGYTVSLNSTMLAALDYYEVEGNPATGSGDLSQLVYTYYYIGGTKLAQFAWVSSP